MMKIGKRERIRVKEIICYFFVLILGNIIIIFGIIYEGLLVKKLIIIF